MKKQLILFIFSLLSVASIAEDLKAFFSYSSFNSPSSGPYVETYLSVIGNSLTYNVTENGKFQGEVEILLIFKKGEEIVNYKKYNLLSPVTDDTLNSFVNFVDQQRFSLKESGAYNLEIEIKDKNTNSDPFIFQQAIQLNYPTDSIKISDIQLAETITKSTTESIITKSGYDIVPYASSFYPENMTKLGFYAEVYNANKQLSDSGRYLVNYFIESYETGVTLSRFKRFARQHAKTVSVVMSEFNISELPSGNYYLVVEARDKKNNILDIKKAFFQRSNPNMEMSMEDLAAISISGSFIGKITNEDSLDMMIASVYPISSTLEKNFVRQQLEKGEQSLEIKQQFFFNFWLNRNRVNPEAAWLKYQKQLKKVNHNYTTNVREGFETDRGRVYLQYGPPNSIVTRPNEPNSYPYEIWHYYKTDRRTNIKFVFADFDAANDYTILHSNAYGEINNFRWQYDLQRRNNPNTDLNAPNGDDHWGNRSNDLFNNPR